MACVYAIPVRPYWEGLFVNVDLFEQHGVELPTTWEKLETGHCPGFREEALCPSPSPCRIFPTILANLPFW